MTSATLTLAVCTLASDLKRAQAVFADLAPTTGVEYLILAQGDTASGRSHYSNAAGAQVSIVTSPSRGLSKNRNMALAEASGERIWFLDNDIEVTNEDIARLLEEIDTHPADIHVCRIRCSDCAGEYKDYSRRRNGLLGLLRVSSIEIIAHRHRLMENGIGFNEQLGLGTAFPSGEENLLLMDAWRAGLGFHFTSACLVAHPCLLEERQPRQAWRDPGLLRSKGIIARQVGGPSGLALCLWWGARALQYTRSAMAPVRVLAGFLRDAKQVAS